MWGTLAAPVAANSRGCSRRWWKDVDVDDDEDVDDDGDEEEEDEKEKKEDIAH